MGSNVKGQLGDGTTTDTSTVKKLINADVVRISAGHENSYFLLKNGELWGMGDNSCGQLGTGSVSNKILNPVKVASDVRRMTAGNFNLLYEKNDGTFWS